MPDMKRTNDRPSKLGTQDANKAASANLSTSPYVLHGSYGQVSGSSFHGPLRHRP